MSSRAASAAALVLFAAGCDPLLSVAGSFFPPWMVATVLGVALTVAVRYVFAAAGLEPLAEWPPATRGAVVAEIEHLRRIVELLPLFDDYLRQAILPRA